MKRIIMIIAAAVLLSIGMVGWFAVSDPAYLIAGTVPRYYVGIDSRLVFFSVSVIAGMLIGNLIATASKGHHR